MQSFHITHHVNPQGILQIQLPDSLANQDVDIIVIPQSRPVANADKKKRPIGLLKGKFAVPDSFFDPLPEDILDAFEGKNA